MTNSIRARREALNWTQKDLMERAGLKAQSAVSDAENGNRVSARKKQAILDALAAAERETSGIPELQEQSTDSSGHAEHASSNDGGMEARRLSAVQPIAATPRNLAPDAERILGEVFDAHAHRLSDANAVARIVARFDVDGRKPEQLRAVFRAMLDSAARLRLNGAEVTPEALLLESLAER